MKSKQKLTINKLIANDIINYSLDDAVCENYIVSLNEYLKDFDDNAKLFNINLEYEDVKKIADNILDDDEFNDDLINRLEDYNNGKDLD